MVKSSAREMCKSDTCGSSFRFYGLAALFSTGPASMLRSDLFWSGICFFVSVCVFFERGRPACCDLICSGLVYVSLFLYVSLIFICILATRMFCSFNRPRPVLCHMRAKLSLPVQSPPPWAFGCHLSYPILVISKVSQIKRKRLKTAEKKCFDQHLKAGQNTQQT